MAMINTAIPFQGYTPNFVNALASGQQAAAQRNELSRMNALANVYQTQGPGILAGETGALNALAGLGEVGQAMGVMDTRQGMDARALQMDATRQNMDLQMREWAASMDDRERQARLQEGQAMMAQIASANTPQAFDALMMQLGKPEMVGQFHMRGQMIDNMRDPIDVLARFDAEQAQQQEFKMDSKAPVEEPASVQALRIRAAEAGLQPGTPDYQAFMMSGGVPSPQAQETVVFGADGLPVFVQAPAGTSANFTEGQSKDILYATRARAALEELDGVGDRPGVADALTRLTPTIADSIPLGLGRYLQPADYQIAQNAGERFLQAILRKDTGAAITREETESYGGVFLPRPGDAPEMAEVRRQARQQALLAIEAGMGPDAILAQGRALVAGGAQTQPNTPIAGGTQQGAQITPQMVPTMSEEALADYLSSTNPRDIPDDVWAAISARTGVQ